MKNVGDALHECWAIVRAAQLALGALISIRATYPTHEFNYEINSLKKALKDMHDVLGTR